MQTLPSNLRWNRIRNVRQLQSSQTRLVSLEIPKWDRCSLVMRLVFNLKISPISHSRFCVIRKLQPKQMFFRAHKNVSILHVYFDVDSTYPKLRQELYGFLDLLCKCISKKPHRQAICK